MEENNFNQDFEVNTEELVKDLKVQPEILDEVKVKNCIHCGMEIESKFQFCTFCGKSQLSQPVESKDPTSEKQVVKKRVVYREKVIKNKLKTLLFSFSIAFFSLSGISFLAGLIKMLFGSNASVSIFGTDTGTLILNATVILSCFLMSILFTILGIFFYKIKSE